MVCRVGCRLTIHSSRTRFAGRLNSGVRLLSKVQLHMATEPKPAKETPSVRRILLRNAIVAVIFVYLFASNLAGYSINFVVVILLIIAAWFIAPITSTARYLWSRWFGDRPSP